MPKATIRRKTTEKITQNGNDTSVSLKNEVTKFEYLEEPTFFKIYETGMDIIRKLDYRELQLFLEISNLISYADEKDLYGGLTFTLSKGEKERIMANMGVKLTTFKNALNGLKKKKVIIKKDSLYFQINPNVVAKGLYTWSPQRSTGGIDSVKDDWNNDNKVVNKEFESDNLKFALSHLQQEIDRIDSRIASLGKFGHKNEIDELMSWRNTFKKQIWEIKNTGYYEKTLHFTDDKKELNENLEDEVNEDGEEMIEQLFPSVNLDKYDSIIKEEQAKASVAFKKDSEQFNTLLEESLPEQLTESITYKTNEDGFMTEIETNEADPF